LIDAKTRDQRICNEKENEREQRLPVKLLHINQPGWRRTPISGRGEES
jgi:hypothetical protein